MSHYLKDSIVFKHRYVKAAQKPSTEWIMIGVWKRFLTAVHTLAFPLLEQARFIWSASRVKVVMLEQENKIKHARHEVQQDTSLHTSGFYLSKDLVYKP